MSELRREGVTRRQAVAISASAAIVVAGGNVIAVAPRSLDLDRADAEQQWIRLAVQLRARLRRLSDEYAEAVRHYLAAGDGWPIAHLRLRARSQLGFYLAFEAVTDQCRSTFRDAGDFIARLEYEFPDVEWDEGTRKRFATLRAWAEAGGQYGTATRAA